MVTGVTLYGEVSFFIGTNSFFGSESFFPIAFILSKFSAGFFIGFTKEGAYNLGVKVGFLTNVCCVDGVNVVAFLSGTVAVLSVDGVNVVVFLSGTVNFLSGTVVVIFLSGTVVVVFYPGTVNADGFYPGTDNAAGFYPGTVNAEGFYPGTVNAAGFYPGTVNADGFYPGTAIVFLSAAYGVFLSTSVGGTFLLKSVNWGTVLPTGIS